MFNKLKLKKDIKSKTIYGGMNMDKHWIIDKIEKLEIKNKDTDVIVLTFDPNHINIGDASTMLQHIEKSYPNHNIIGTVKDMADFSVENIDYMIDKLQKIKEEKKNENIH